MENYTITKKQILSLYDNAIKDNSDIIEIDLKEYFPDAFKKELEVGKWYKSNAGRIVFRRGDSDNYGFCREMIWRKDLLCYDNNNWKEATDEQVEASLINEAKKRGYKKGIKVTPLYSDGSPHDNINVKILEDKLSFDEHQNSLDFNNSSYRLFCKGKWAEIIPDETKVISMEKAVKILSKKYGKKVTIK